MSWNINIPYIDLVNYSSIDLPVGVEMVVNAPEQNQLEKKDNVSDASLLQNLVLLNNRMV